MPQLQKKRHISKRTATTRLFTDDEREVQRRATNEGKERSEIIRQAVSNAFRTERLALARYTRDAGNYVELTLRPAGSVPLR